MKTLKSGDCAVNSGPVAGLRANHWTKLFVMFWTFTFFCRQKISARAALLPRYLLAQLLWTFMGFI